jgi:hypothetical protein
MGPNSSVMTTNLHSDIRDRTANAPIVDDMTKDISNANHTNPTIWNSETTMHSISWNKAADPGSQMCVGEAWETARTKVRALEGVGSRTTETKAAMTWWEHIDDDSSGLDGLLILIVLELRFELWSNGIVKFYSIGVL